MTAKITVVGLGSGDENQLTLGVWNKLQSGVPNYLRTGKHPVVPFLEQNHIPFTTFDPVYEKHSTFQAVYEEIVSELFTRAKELQGEIVYAVPGHPMVAESTIQQLLERADKEGIQLEIIGGESFLDQAFLRLGFDPIEGFQLLDGSQFDGRQIQPQLHTIIAQVYDRMTASDVKLGLMDIYPDDYPVVVGHALGVMGEEQVQRIPLYELDRIDGYGNQSLIWIPRTQEESIQNRTFNQLRDIVRILRSPEGCPWDRAQTHTSIRKNLIEETYEVLETIDDDDPDAMCEELGDLLLQIMLHAQMEEEIGTFTITDVIAGINEKLIRRHPHVFADQQADNPEEALKNWQQIKAEEKRKKGIRIEEQSILSGIPRDLPSLLKAYELQKKAAKVGFDWDRLEDVIHKIEEEMAELKEVAFDETLQQKHQEELGDLLFAVVNVARFLHIDPEGALARTNRKFIQRFSYIEEQLRLNGKDFAQTDLIEMERWWKEAKRAERS